MTMPDAGSGNIIDNLVEFFRGIGSDTTIARRAVQDTDEELAALGCDDQTLANLDYQQLNTALNAYPAGHVPPTPPPHISPPPPGVSPTQHVHNEINKYVTQVYEGDEYVFKDNTFVDNSTELTFEGDPVFKGDFEVDVDNVTADDGGVAVNDSHLHDTNLNTGDNVAQAGGDQEQVVAGADNQTAQIDIDQQTGAGGFGGGAGGGTATGGGADGGDAGGGTGHGHGGDGTGGGGLFGGGDVEGGDGTGYGGHGGSGGDGGYGGDASADGGYGGDANGGDIGDVDIDVDFGENVEVTGV